MSTKYMMILGYKPPYKCTMYHETLTSTIIYSKGNSDFKLNFRFICLLSKEGLTIYGYKFHKTFGKKKNKYLVSYPRLLGMCATLPACSRILAITVYTLKKTLQQVFRCLFEPCGKALLVYMQPTFTVYRQSKFPASHPGGP